MKKLLYFGHDFHNRTKSTQFLQDILATEYDIEKFNFDPYTDDFSVLEQLKGKEFDVVILFQIMPPIKLLQRYIKWNHIAFFPMYDATHDLKHGIWYEYRDVNIINFSNTLHEMCLKYGFSSYYIQFFPKPGEIKDWGDEKAIFFWQRINKINPELINKVVGAENIDKLYLHDVPDPGHKSMPVPKDMQSKTVKSEWFETKEEAQKYIQQAALYVAPREFEGFGNSYLDAMSLGRCVISANNPAMNEYIKDGYNGYLYDLYNPKKITISDIRTVQKNAYEYIKKGYETFESQKFEILKWIIATIDSNKILLYRNYYKNNVKNWFFKKERYGNKRKITILGFINFSYSKKV